MFWNNVDCTRVGKDPGFSEICRCDSGSYADSWCWIFAMAYNIPSTVEYYYGKTSFIAVGTVLAAVLNVTTNAIFIPQYGYLAAAYTTLGSYMVYFIFHCIIAHRIIGQNIFSIKVLLTTVAGVSVIGVISLYYQNNYVVRYSFAAAVVVVVLVWLKKGALADFGFNVGIGKRS